MIILELEAIGHDTHQLVPGARPMPWVAEITGRDPTFGLRRAFVRPAHTDYFMANSVGSRGVYHVYHLPPGVYEVSERTSWSARRRYFLRVGERGTSAITREDVDRWLAGERGPAPYYVPQ